MLVIPSVMMTDVILSRYTYQGEWVSREYDCIAPVPEMVNTPLSSSSHVALTPHSPLLTIIPSELSVPLRKNTQQTDRIIMSEHALMILRLESLLSRVLFFLERISDTLERLSFCVYHDDGMKR